MDLGCTSIGVVGALRAFPLRSAARRIADRGGRLHRGLQRGTSIAVFCRSLLTRLSATEIAQRVEGAQQAGVLLRSEAGFLQLLAQTAPPASGMPRQSLLDQSGLAPENFDLLALFDAFERDSEPFSFRDLILSRKYAGLLASGASWHEIVLSLHGAGPVSALTALSLEARGEKILALDAHSLAELDGQRLLPLSTEEDVVEDYFSHAETAEDAGLFVEASTLYAHCATLDPGDATSPFNEGNCRREMGDLGGALLAYARSIKRDALLIEAWTNAAGVLRALGRIAAAREHLHRAIAIDADYADAIYNLAALEYDAGDIDAAAALWRRYLELDDTSDWARRARAGLVLAAQTRRHAG